MHRNILGTKRLNRVERTREVLGSFVVQPSDKIDVNIEPVRLRQRVLVVKVARRMRPADFYQRIVVQSLRVYAYSRRSDRPDCFQFFGGYRIGSARFYRELNVPKRKTVK